MVEGILKLNSISNYLSSKEKVKTSSVFLVITENDYPSESNAQSSHSYGP